MKTDLLESLTIVAAAALAIHERMFYMPGFTFAEYQARAHKTAVYPNVGRDITYPALGLAGETGEVCEKIKKVLRDHGGKVNGQTLADLEKEIGDVLWYLAELTTVLGLDLETIAKLNIEKLASRQARGVLNGSGDER